ncbi:MAG: ABC transporter substrate-binding protein [Alphaproteobacteria bacterium]|nr:ABC transporter substrate-binding protein [Alphaproteobacteria bacterium]
MSMIGRWTAAAGVAILSSTGFVTPALAQADVLKIGVATLPPSRGNPSGHAGAITSYTYAAIFDALTKASATGDIIPDLAESWRNVDTNTWRFTLRPNVKFQNGEPLTAAAFVQMAEYYLTDEGKASVNGRDLSRAYTSARAIDDLTVEFKTATPNPAFATNILRMHVVAPKAWKDMGVESFANAPIGTGPFKVDAWRPESVRLAAFEGSWRAPKMKSLEILALPEITARVQALVSGQIDIAPAVSVDAAKTIEAAGHKADIIAGPYVLAWALLGTYRDTPFKDKRVRQAVNYAINKEAIVNGLLLGKAKPASQAASPLTFGYNPDVKPYPYDPDRAKKLLAEAGYANGFEMDVIVLPGNFPADADIYQAAAQDLGKIGVKTNLKPLTFAEYLKVLFNPVPKEEFGKGWGDKVMAFQQDFSVDLIPDAINRWQATWSCRRAGVSFYCNDDEIKLIDAANAEFDVEKRRKILQDGMKMIHENAPGIFLVEIVDVLGRSSKVQNAKLTFRVLNYHEITKTN